MTTLGCSRRRISRGDSKRSIAKNFRIKRSSKSGKRALMSICKARTKILPNRNSPRQVKEGTPLTSKEGLEGSGETRARVKKEVWKAGLPSIRLVKETSLRMKTRKTMSNQDISTRSIYQPSKATALTRPTQPL